MRDNRVCLMRSEKDTCKDLADPIKKKVTRNAKGKREVYSLVFKVCARHWPIYNGRQYVWSKKHCSRYWECSTSQEKKIID